MPEVPLARRAAAEFTGALLLVLAIVGSGIAAQRLSPADAGLQLLENALATVFSLTAILLALGPVSGAHLNPIVTLVEAAAGRLARRDVLPYVAAQITGAACGALLANALHGRALFEIATTDRSALRLAISEAVATFGLLVVIRGVSSSPSRGAAPFAIAAYVGGAYWFTSSTAFANPAVTLGRMLSDSFAGIAPASVPGFLAGQLVGAYLAAFACERWFPPAAPAAPAARLPASPGAP
jgi:glycerol uptake facilitator-like aquaporin